MPPIHIESTVQQWSSSPSSCPLSQPTTLPTGLSLLYFFSDSCRITSARPFPIKELSAGAYTPKLPRSNLVFKLGLLKPPSCLPSATISLQNELSPAPSSGPSPCLVCLLCFRCMWRRLRSSSATHMLRGMRSRLRLWSVRMLQYESKSSLGEDNLHRIENRGESFSRIILN